MFNNLQFRKLIVEPAIKALNLYSQEAEDLLVGTCAQESRGGTYLFQQGTNPDLYASLQKNILAVGPFQMEPRTHDDLWDRFILSNKKLQELCGKTLIRFPASTMVYNLYYATCMARLFYYFRSCDPIPKTLELQARYYKKYYNTPMGKATVEDYIKNYNIFVGHKS